MTIANLAVRTRADDRVRGPQKGPGRNDGPLPVGPNLCTIGADTYVYKKMGAQRRAVRRPARRRPPPGCGAQHVRGLTATASGSSAPCLTVIADSAY